MTMTRLLKLNSVAWALLVIAAVNLAGGGCVSRGIAQSLHAISTTMFAVFGGQR